MIIGDRWPKSGIEVVITILEGEEDQWWNNKQGASSNHEQWSLMSVLSGCITVASAAIADAGIDCVDMVAGGVAALVQDKQGTSLVLDPVPSEHVEILSACTVGYLSARDEVTDLWVWGDTGALISDGSTDAGVSYEDFVNSAVQAARGSHAVLAAALKEAALLKYQS